MKGQPFLSCRKLGVLPVLLKLQLRSVIASLNHQGFAALEQQSPALQKSTQASQKWA